MIQIQPKSLKPSWLCVVSPSVYQLETKVQKGCCSQTGVLHGRLGNVGVLSSARGTEASIFEAWTTHGGVSYCVVEVESLPATSTVHGLFLGCQAVQGTSFLSRSLGGQSEKLKNIGVSAVWTHSSLEGNNSRLTRLYLDGKNLNDFSLPDVLYDGSHPTYHFKTHHRPWGDIHQL